MPLKPISQSASLKNTMLYPLNVYEDPESSIRPSAPCSADRFESLASDGESIESINAHHLDILGIAGEVEANDDNEVGEYEDAAFEVVALQMK